MPPRPNGAAESTTPPAPGTCSSGRSPPAEHAAVGRRVRAIDRDNVGLILGIDDTAGTCEVHFESVDGRTAVKCVDWSELVVIDQPDSVDTSPAAQAILADRRRSVEIAERAWAAALAEHDVL